MDTFRLSYSKRPELLTRPSRPWLTILSCPFRLFVISIFLDEWSRTGLLKTALNYKLKLLFHVAAYLLFLSFSEYAGFMLVTNLVKIFTNAWWPMSTWGCVQDLLALRSAGLVNL